MFIIIYLKKTLFLAIQQLQLMVNSLLRSVLFWNITQLVVVMLFHMLNVLYIYISTSSSMCAVSDTEVFCSSSILCFSVTRLRYYLNDSEMFPVAPIVTGITSVLYYTCAVFLLSYIYI